MHFLKTVFAFFAGAALAAAGPIAAPVSEQTPTAAQVTGAKAAATGSVPWEALLRYLATGQPGVVKTLYPEGYSATPSPVLEETTVVMTVEPGSTTTITSVDPDAVTTPSPVASTISTPPLDMESAFPAGYSWIKSLETNGELATPAPAAETSPVKAPAAPVMDLPAPTASPDAPDAFLHARDTAAFDAATFDAAIAASASMLRDHLVSFNAAFEDASTPNPTDKLSADTLAVLKHAGREILLHGLHLAEREGLPAILSVLNGPLPATALDFLERVPGKLIADLTTELQRGQPVRRSDSDSDSDDGMYPNDPLGPMGFTGDGAWAAYPGQCEKYMGDHPNSLCPLFRGLHEVRRAAAEGGMVERRKKPPVREMVGATVGPPLILAAFALIFWPLL